MSGIDSGRSINVSRLWSGGLATAVVAGLVILVGALIVRGVFGIPVLAPEEAGYLGDATTGVYAATAAIAALIATALLHLLMLSAPRPMTFFGWIVGLATVVAAVTPFTQGAPLASQIATGLINAVCGIAIVSLLSSVGASAYRRSERPRLHGEGALPGAGFDPGYGADDYESGYRDAFSEQPRRRYDGRHRSYDPDARTRPDRD
ncbi:DUF6069 family protein [Nocardiopsis sp. RSe5-2]|uniref:DUF6069 family protein n=1 Tax=Nocardiopsis endophytica TaxID=3018445 RepID=A0ABT4U621_9ACTN|nr:DUF6069 family protein [Nocardiopsis endophytica]MDA2812394.1 DUF6069 family protein [Nocardiopsis endophytica]